MEQQQSSTTTPLPPPPSPPHTMSDTMSDTKPWSWIHVGTTCNRKRNKKPGFNIEGGPVLVTQVVNEETGTFKVKRILQGGHVVVRWEELENTKDMGKREFRQRRLLDPTTGDAHVPSLDSGIVQKRLAGMLALAAKRREKKEKEYALIRVGNIVATTAAKKAAESDSGSDSASESDISSDDEPINQRADFKS